jgi:CheY-like chemotaxis protein
MNSLTQLPSSPSLPNKPVLVLDDNPANRRETARLLEKNFDVLQASTNSEAIETAKRRDLGAVLIDHISEDEIGSIETALNILSIRPYASIIFYSGEPKEAILEQAAQAGLPIADFIEKPADLLYLRKRVAKETIKARLREEMGSKVGEISARVASLPADLATEIFQELSTEAPTVNKDRPTMQELADSIDAVYDKMRALVESHGGKPGLREKLRPLRDELRALQEEEARQIGERYDAHFRPAYERAQEAVAHARQLLGTKR